MENLLPGFYIVDEELNVKAQVKGTIKDGKRGEVESPIRFRTFPSAKAALALSEQKCGVLYVP